MDEKYVPGVCNIGPAEIKARKLAGWVGVGLTALLWVLFIWLEIPSIWRLALFFPAMMSAVGFFQAYTHFCVYFGLAALFNFGDLGKTDSVQQAEFRALDRKKAWKIIISAILAGGVVALVGFLAA